MMPKLMPGRFATLLSICALAVLLLVPVTAHAAGVVDFDAGDEFSLAVLSDGTLWGWGLNAQGQLGDGTLQLTHLAPVKSVAATGWADVAAGRRHSLALKSDGSLWSWGWNREGQLGLGHAEGTYTPTHWHASPAQVGSSTNWLQVDAGYDHSVALDKNHQIWAWGANDEGQLGDGSYEPTASPALVSEEPDIDVTWVRVWAGDQVTYALASDGVLWEWGAAVGPDPEPIFVSSPDWSDPLSSDDWGFFSVSGNRADAILSSTELFSWIPGGGTDVGAYYVGPEFTQVGEVVDPANEFEAAVIVKTYGQLATAATPLGKPIRFLQDDGKVAYSEWAGLSNALNWKRLATGRNHFLISKTDGSLWGWGINYYGQLGDGSELSRKMTVYEPARVVLPTPVPFVVGMTQSDAVDKIQEMGFEVGTVTQVATATVPITLVMQQTPVQDTLVLPGNKVNITVSAGPPIPVPNVVGKTEADARTAIGAAGLGVGSVISAYSPVVPLGSVMVQNPVADTPVIIASKVGLTISKGPEPATVPYTTNLVLNSAKSSLEARGFVVGTVTYEYSTTVKLDRVIRTDPLAGSSSFQGRTVNLVVSLGKRKAPVTTPAARATMRKGKYYTVSGYVKPLHTSRSYYVRIYKWHKTKTGTWVRSGYVNAKLTPLTASSKYSVKLRLGITGRWRIRACAPEDAEHAETWSTKYDYIKVK